MEMNKEFLNDLVNELLKWKKDDLEVLKKEEAINSYGEAFKQGRILEIESSVSVLELIKKYIG